MATTTQNGKKAAGSGLGGALAIILVLMAMAGGGDKGGGGGDSSTDRDDHANCAHVFGFNKPRIGPSEIHMGAKVACTEPPDPGSFHAELELQKGSNRIGLKATREDPGTLTVTAPRSEGAGGYVRARIHYNWTLRGKPGEITDISDGRAVTGE